VSGGPRGPPRGSSAPLTRNKEPLAKAWAPSLSEAARERVVAQLMADRTLQLVPADPTKKSGSGLHLRVDHARLQERKRPAPIGASSRCSQKSTSYKQPRTKPWNGTSNPGPTGLWAPRTSNALGDDQPKHVAFEMATRPRASPGIRPWPAARCARVGIVRAAARRAPDVPCADTVVFARAPLTL
jgi:hypothetical protein